MDTRSKGGFRGIAQGAENDRFWRDSTHHVFGPAGNVSRKSQWAEGFG